MRPGCCPLHGGFAHPAAWKGLRGPGISSRYHVTGEGPGVTPHVAVLVKDPGTWNAKISANVRAQQDADGLLKQLNLGSCA